MQRDGLMTRCGLTGGGAVQHCGLLNCAADRTEAAIPAAGTRHPGFHWGTPAAHQTSCQRCICCRYTACEDSAEGDAYTRAMLHL